MRLSNADFLEFELDFLYVSEPEDSSSKKRLAEVSLYCSHLYWIAFAFSFLNSFFFDLVSLLNPRVLSRDIPEKVDPSYLDDLS